MSVAEITIKSGNSAPITFTPQQYKISYDSLAGPQSGRDDSGIMNIDWILPKLTKLEITLPPHKYDDSDYNKILSYVQGQIIKITYYDYLEGAWRNNIKFYCSNCSAGIHYMDLVLDVEFNCEEMDGESTPPAPVQTYTISTAVSPSGTGSVSGGGTYASGSQISLNATPEAGYLFSQWNDGNIQNPRTVTVSSDKTYTATFVAYVPPTPGTWTITFDDSLIMGEYISDPDPEDEDYHEWYAIGTLNFEFTCNGRSYSRFYTSEPYEESCLSYYDNELQKYTFVANYYPVYEEGGDKRCFVETYYRTIVTTVNPATIFVDEPDSVDNQWATFLTKNATVTQN